MCTDPDMDTITEAFDLIMQKGIGGAPPTPTARYLVSRPPRSTSFFISTSQRLHGEAGLKPIIPHRELKVATYTDSIIRLQSILRAIPVQEIGTEDIYGRDTSIVQITDQKRSADFPIEEAEEAEGAGGITLPTEEQKVLFDEAVGIIEKWCDPNGASE